MSMTFSRFSGGGLSRKPRKRGMCSKNAAKKKDLKK
jgi:hypothetical protein